jgi:hypothetical protein
MERVREEAAADLVCPACGASFAVVAGESVWMSRTP